MKNIQISKLTYEMLVELSKKPNIKAELYLEALIRKAHAEKSNYIRANEQYFLGTFPNL